jgi:hypothetical protein
MKEIATYCYGSFNDYKGQEHKIIVCALSQRVNCENSVETNVVHIYSDVDDDWGDESYVAKILSFGVAICNPIDNYNQEHGEMIAYNRAKKYEDCPLLTSSRAGFFNTATVTAILNNYIDYIQKDPGSAIAGYDRAKEKFYEEQDLKNDVSKMTEDEKSKIKILATSAPENIEYAKKVIKFIK